jgi:hypothetical protein
MADKDFKVKSGLDLGTPLPLTEGGTGQTSASNALNALLPVQTDNTSKFLQTDGTNTSWVAAAVANNATFTGSSMVIPSGTNAERPASPVTGAIRLNTDQGTLEFWTGTSWGAIATFPQPPRNLVATDVGTSRAYNNAGASVAFDLPTGNGGSTITSYKITSNPGGYYATGSSSPIVVSGLQASTSYTFSGIAINSIGNSADSTSTSSITATTVPQQVTIGTATNVGSSRPYNDAAATVTFTPGATGGKSVTYTATSTPGSYTATGSSPITVTGLQSNTAYTFTVTPSNANGSGTVSSATSSITATTVPQAPTIGTATDTTTGGTVSLTFTAGATGGSSITNYKYSTDGTNYTAFSPAQTTSPLTISGLTNGTAYTIRLKAVNSNGDSSATSASNSVTPTVFAATGGTIVTSGGYKYHTFTSNGTFAVTGSKSMEWLVIAGGGGGAGARASQPDPEFYGAGGGGGAGGVIQSSGTITAASYSIVVGSGGNGSSSYNMSSGGSPSSFSSTSCIGGGGNGEDAFGQDGGSGGGGYGRFLYSSSEGIPLTAYGYRGGFGTSGQGNNGGSGGNSGTGGSRSFVSGGGGGGKGGVGGNGSGGTGGTGGSATSSYSTWASATSTGSGGSYAGGGGGGGRSSGGSGGGGGAGNASASASSNTGSGGGGSSSTGGNGGSGVVIIRYAV